MLAGHVVLAEDQVAGRVEAVTDRVLHVTQDTDPAEHPAAVVVLRGDLLPGRDASVLLLAGQSVQLVDVVGSVAHRGGEAGGVARARDTRSSNSTAYGPCQTVRAVSWLVARLPAYSSTVAVDRSLADRSSAATQSNGTSSSTAPRLVTRRQLPFQCCRCGG
jgi:hypothetical protein